MEHKPDPTSWQVVATSPHGACVFALCTCGGDCGWTIWADATKAVQN